MFDVVVDCSHELSPRLPLTPINQDVFQPSKKAFPYSIVPALTSTAHPTNHALLG